MATVYDPFIEGLNLIGAPVVQSTSAPTSSDGGAIGTIWVVPGSGVYVLTNQVGSVSTWTLLSSGGNQEIIVTVAPGSAVALTNNTTANLAILPLTRGTWDISLMGTFTGSPTGTQTRIGISTTSSTFASLDGKNSAISPTVPTSGGDITLTTAPLRVTPTGNTNYYGLVRANFTVGSVSAYGVIRAVKMSE